MDQDSLDSAHDFNRSIRIGLLSQFCSTIMYLQPRLDVMGKHPVWTEEIFPLVDNFDMGEMGSSTRNFKLFWRRHDICLFFLVYILLFLTEISLGRVDYFWEMIVDKGFC